jgi:hypothetical protein
MKWSVIANAFSGNSINKVDCCKKSLVLVFQRHRCIGKQGGAHFNNVHVLLFGHTILLVCVRAGDPMGDAKGAKERVKSFIFTAPVNLHSNNFMI